MRLVPWALAAAAAGLLVGCQADHEKAPSVPAPAAGQEKPLRLDEEEPLLLLDEPVKAASTPTSARGPVADNSRCYVCHLNYSDEELTLSHAVADVGCAKCHGPSDAHCGDEGNVTPPTIFYTKADIDPSCTVCHDPDKVVSGALYCLHVRTPEEADKLCTECHGAHRMAVRTFRWNPKTRKPYLVSAQGE